jgi:hypothetical protein
MPPVGIRIRDRAGPLLRAAVPLAALWLATWALLLLPDVLLHWSGYAVQAATSLKATLFAAIIALLICTAKSRRFRLAVIAFLALNQLIWTGYVVYFGQALSPEHLILFQHEATDTLIGVLADWRILLPWLLVLLAGSGALSVLQWREGANARWRSRISGVTFITIMIAAVASWMLHPRIDAAFPGKHTASMYGPFQAAGGLR